MMAVVVRIEDPRTVGSVSEYVGSQGSNGCIYKEYHHGDGCTYGGF